MVHEHLIRKVYFPRLIVPIAAVAVAVVGLLQSFLILVVMMDCTWLADPAIAFFRGNCLPGEPRARLVDYGTQRQVPGFSLRNSVSRPGWHLCLAHWVQFQCGTGPVAIPLFPQSYDRCHRWVPLVHPRRGEPALSSRFWSSIAVTAFLLWFGVRQFRKMEKSFVDII
jgi:lipopolysaccharide transport system permease protein